MLIAVFLAGSDEAQIVISAHPDKLPLMVGLIGMKILVAICDRGEVVVRVPLCVTVEAEAYGAHIWGIELID